MSKIEINCLDLINFFIFLARDGKGWINEGRECESWFDSTVARIYERKLSSWPTEDFTWAK